MKLLRLAAGCWVTAAMLTMGLTTAASAQPRLRFGQPVDFGVSGFHLYNVTGAMEYTSVAGPVSAGTTTSGLGGDYIGFASLSAGYSKTTTNGSFSVTYSPGYTAHVRYSDLHYLNQDLTIIGTKRLNSQWTLFGNIGGADTTSDSFLFASGSTAGVLGGGATGGVEAGPAATILFGNRVLTARALAGLIYRPSTRLRIAFNVETALDQTRKTNLLPGDAVVPRNFYIGGGVTMGYSLNPRTEFGVAELTVRNSSMYGDYQTTTVLPYIYRRLSPHWSGSVGAGPAFTTYLSALTATGPVKITSVSYTSVATIGYDVGQSRFSSSYGRAAGDAYGLGTGASNSVNGNWDFQSTRTGISLKAFAGQVRFTGGVFGGLTVTNAGGSVGRYLSQHWSTSLDYSYMRYSGNFATKSFEDHIARVSLTWVPFLRDALALRVRRQPQVNPGDPVPAVAVTP